MATTLNRKTFYEAIQCLKDNVTPSELAEASTYAVFCNNRICCSNDSVGVSVPLVTDVKNCAVELQLLYDFIHKMNDKEVIIGMHNGNLKIKGKNSVAEFAVREDIIYDESLIHLNVNDFKRLPETFATALNFTGFATDGTKEAYSRCVIHDGAMYALSNVRAARFFMGEEAKSLFDGMTFISPECIGFVNKMCPKRYYISDGYVHLYDDEMRIYSTRTRSDANFPINGADEALELPSSSEFRFPPDFDQVLDRCNPFSGKDAKVKRVTIDIEKGVLTILARREDGSTFRERVANVQCKEHVRFTVLLKLLSDMVKLVEVFRVDSSRIVGTAPMYTCMACLFEE